MSAEHWNDEQLVARLYGLGPADDHLARCADCRARWERIEHARGRLLGRELPVSERLLSEQRRAVFDRLETDDRFDLFRLIPSAAVVVLLLVALLVLQPGPVPAPQEAVSDRELFQEVYSMVSDPAPRALEPVRSLFEVQQ